MSAKTRTYNPVDASPVKSFFVTMLTRDIELSDAILDLLDNCVDGIHRSKKKGQDHKPFGGFKASINFDATYFKIEDNCGGIPWGLHDYAFRMGKASGKEEKLGTVGVYGIGMKRAIFKIGNDCKITSQNASDSYEVEISSRWIADEKEWNLPVKAAQKLGHDGTAVYIKKLNSGIADQFSDSAFEADLIKKIQTHYSIIILKGFEVKVNGTQQRRLVLGSQPGRPAGTGQRYHRVPIVHVPLQRSACAHDRDAGAFPCDQLGAVSGGITGLDLEGESGLPGARS